MKAKKAKGAKNANGGAVAEITAAQAKDELQARELAQRLIDLSHHCEEALYHCPDEPLFSVESLFAAEAERAKRDGTPKRVICRAVAICRERAEVEEKERERITTAWKARIDEIMRCDFIDRRAESKAFFEAHKNDPDEGRGAVAEYNAILRAERKRNEEAAQADPFYYVTPKTPKPSGAWWHSRIVEYAERLLLTHLSSFECGKMIGRCETRERWLDDEKWTREHPADFLGHEGINLLLHHLTAQARRTHGDAAATAMKAAHDIVKAFTGGMNPGAVKAMQRERAAQWMKDEAAKGNAPSIAQAALQFGGEIASEFDDGGYATTDALRTGLYKFADDLDIGEFKKRGK